MAGSLTRPIFEGSFRSIGDERNGEGKRPVIFDIIGPDDRTSLLPDDLKLVLHVNPSTMSVSYQKVITRIQTRGGFVEQHWGEGPGSINLEAATGAFARLYVGLTNITGGGLDAGGNRRETIAYEKYLDFLALFKNNGSIYDNRGQIAFQGSIKITFDGESHFGWFNSFKIDYTSLGLSVLFYVQLDEAALASQQLP